MVDGVKVEWAHLNGQPCWCNSAIPPTQPPSTLVCNGRSTSSSDAHRKSHRFCLLCATSSSLRAIILSFQSCSTKSWRQCFQKFLAACFGCLLGIVSNSQGCLAFADLWRSSNSALISHQHCNSETLMQLSLTRALHLSSLSTECAMVWFSLSGKIL